MTDESRRALLKGCLSTLGSIGSFGLWSNVLIGCSNENRIDGDRVSLQAADANGVRLIPGLVSRIVARSSQPVIPGASFRWHAAPDGGTCFVRDQGGWIYVSNSEVDGSGGVGALAFDGAGTLVDAYSILSGTDRNCAGGSTPWGSWLSCEEIDRGQVFECYPQGGLLAQTRPALGKFKHEAVAVDTSTGHLYLTEDETDGCLYRYVARRRTGEGYPDLSDGVLQVAIEGNDGELGWVDLPDPLATTQATREQLPQAKRFDGGEGIDFHDGTIIFATKGDDRIWSYDTGSSKLKVLYDASEYVTPLLTGVDNVTVSQTGDIYVAEDGGDLQIVVIDRQGNLYPLLQLEGHRDSEITGPAFSPDGKRLYFSSQRGTVNRSEQGITYEISGF